MYAQSLAYYLLHDKHLINVVYVIAFCYSSHLLDPRVFISSPQLFYTEELELLVKVTEFRCFSHLNGIDCNIGCEIWIWQ